MEMNSVEAEVVVVEVVGLSGDYSIDFYSLKFILMQCYKLGFFFYLGIAIGLVLTSIDSALLSGTPVRMKYLYSLSLRHIVFPFFLY